MATDLANHWKVLEVFDGRRMYPDFSYGLIPYGWVVNAHIPESIRSLFRCPVIPLKPGGWNLFTRLNAHLYVRAMKRTYLDGLMLMVPHDRPEGGYFTRFVYLEDLQKEPSQLMTEMISISQSGNSDLAEMKECAYVAITGVTDLG